MAEYRDYGPAAPHGPDMSGTHDPVHEMTQNERQIFDFLIKPDDSYDSAGVYWADLPLSEQIKFVTKGDAVESRKELSNIWTMFKKDPLSPFAYYFKNMVLPGAGLGLEGYALLASSPFSVDVPDMSSSQLETSSPFFKPGVLSPNAGRARTDSATRRGSPLSTTWRSRVSLSARFSLVYSVTGELVPP